MSNVPYTTLRVNPGGIDVFHFGDYVYLMAPALQGGMLLDDFGVPIVDKTNRITFTPKIIGNIAACEQEFGLASAGSPMSIYARWILDRVSVPLVCRRVVSSTLSSAYITLKDRLEQPILWIESRAKTELANRIMLDISESSLSEFFFSKPNAVFLPDNNVLHIEQDYTNNDRLIFDGIYNQTLRFRTVITPVTKMLDYDLFNFKLLQIENESTQYIRMVDGIKVEELRGNQCSFYSATNEIVFGTPPPVGLYSLVIHGEDPYGNPTQLFLSPDGVSQTYKIRFEPNLIQFNDLFANGYSTENIVTNTNIVRLFTLKDVANQTVDITCVNGTITGTTKLIINATGAQGIVTEEFDDLISYRDLINRINDITTGSNILKGELLVEEDANVPVPHILQTTMSKVGFQVTLYLDGYTETYDNLKDVSQLEFELNYKSMLVRAVVMNHANTFRPIMGTVGLRLRNGDSGLAPTTIDYLDALVDAEKLEYITLLIAPGVSDPSFHALIKKHCNEMFKRGKYRTAVVGGDLNETSETKKNRGLSLSHERVSVVGDGLKLVSPLTGVAELFSPAVCVAAFVSQILSEYYFVSQTHKIMESAKGVEHEYDDAQLEELHSGRLVLFQKTKFGVQIVDGITTSPVNAYEDIHMVRIFDTISRNTQKIMEKHIGQSNMPVTWAQITSVIKKMLDIMKDSDAIRDYRFITEVRSQDVVDRRYKFRIGIVPVFPVKYIEGFVDIFPPYAVET